MLKAGDVIDNKYTIIQKVGGGGMSNVYLARNEIANKNWAVKECKQLSGKKRQFIAKQSLVREANTLKNLKHKYLPSIVDIYTKDGILLVMDYIEGKTLKYYVQNFGMVSENLILKWGMELCEVLDYLHSQNPPIIYRDMKPENVMLRTDTEDFKDGHICLIDFGISREFDEEKTNDTVLLGTRGFASPEQSSPNVQTGIPSDIYSLGATLYYLATGHDPCEPPFLDKSIIEYNPSLSIGLDTILRKCVEQDPNNRYQDCKELHYALSHCSEQDKKYKIKLIKKVVGAGILFFFFLLSTIICSFSYYKEQQLINTSYKAYIEDAVTKTETSDRLKLYEKAIQMQPKSTEGYLGIYQTLLEDDVLTTTEDTYLRNFFEKEIGKYTTEEYLAMNQEVYSDFAYDLAMSYWYSYQSVKEDKTLQPTREYRMASYWFSKVTLYNNSELCRRKFETAKIYEKMGSYYSRIGMINKAGDSEIKYSDYYKDLMSVYEIKCSNHYTRLYLNKDILSQIIEHSIDYRAEGVEKKELEETIYKISKEISSFKKEKENDYYTQLLEDAISSVELAKSSIQNAYSYKGGENID